MVGAATHPATGATRRAFAPQASQLRVIEELESLRKALPKTICVCEARSAGQLEKETEMAIKWFKPLVVGFEGG